MKPVLLMLTRPGCGLCEELEAELAAHFGPDAFELSHADVDSREDWRRRYGLKIPVLLDGQGELLCSIKLDVDALTAYRRA